MMVKFLKVSLIGLGVILVSSTMSEADQVSDMQDELAMRINVGKKYHQKHAKALVTAAQDEVFKKYFTASSKEEKKKLKKEIDQISLAVQAKSKVDEMCLIDKTGQEISRIVYREIAPDADLASEEASAPFFKPSFAKKAKKTYISTPYMSADSLRWVISYATPIVLEDGSKPAIYHYEMPLYSFQKRVNRGLKKGGSKFLLLVNGKGYIMSDSRQRFKLELRESDKEMKAPLGDYFPLLKESELGPLASKIKSGAEGVESLQNSGKEYRIVFRPLEYQGWTAVLVSKKK